MSDVAEKPKSRGGRPRKSIEDHLRDGTYRPGRHREWLEGYQRERGELAASIIEAVGLSPRRRLLAGDDPGVRTDGEHFARFCEELCRHTKGRWAGRPLALEPWQRAYFDEALRFDDEGRRIYRRCFKGIPRKNGKSTETSALALYLGSPAEGEAEPEVILAAGSREQAGPLFEQAIGFVDTSPTLSRDYTAQKIGIECAANRGRIRRIAADGKLAHGLNPSAIAADELHAWITPKQRELWAALTTADGARDDAQSHVITTAGYDLSTILGELYTAARDSEFYEPRPDMGPGGFVTQDEENGLLVWWWGIATNTSLEDVEAFQLANPASWRTVQRLARDLADPFVDEPTKLRLYGNVWTAAKDRWIAHDVWQGLRGPTEIPLDEPVCVGVDAARTRDTTACVWAWRSPEGRIVIRARVWTTRADAPAHVRVQSARLNNDDVRDFIAAELNERYRVSHVLYDERYFSSQADDLSDDGFNVVEMHQGKPEMLEAVDTFYGAAVNGELEHDGDDVLTAHIAATAGQKTERGWKISKVRATNPIDATVAACMARWGAENFTSSVYESSGLTIL